RSSVTGLSPAPEPRDIDAMLDERRRLAGRRRAIRAAAALRVEQPVRAARAIRVQPLAVVAAHALGHEDLALADCAPLAFVLAELAAAALGPPRDAKCTERRQQPERRADRTEEAAIEIADEDARD